MRAEPQGDEAGSLRGELQRLHRRAAACCALESLLLAATAGGLAGAAARWSGAPAFDVHVAGSAVLCGVFAGLTWWSEKRRDLTGEVRRADRKLGADGALQTGFEMEGREGVGALAQLLARRAHGQLSNGWLRRLAPAPSAVWWALPVAAGALLALSAERSVGPHTSGPHNPGPNAPAGSPISGGAASLGAVLDAARGERRDPQSGAESWAVRLGASSEAGPQTQRAVLDQFLAELERELESASDPALRRALEDSARRARDEREALASREEVTVDTQLEPADRAGGASSGAGAGAGLAGGGAERTIDGIGTDPPGGQKPPSGATGARSSASSAGRWWPPRHDAIVADWVEARRIRARSNEER